MSGTIRDELKNKYRKDGGQDGNLTNDSQTIQGMLRAMNNIEENSLKNVVVAPMAGTEILWGHHIEALQDNIVVENGRIKGNLYKVTEGQLVTAWGEGYFLALTFDDDEVASVEDIQVGLSPSEGTGYLPLDSDKAGVFKITNKYNQRFVVFKTVNGVKHTQVFRLEDLNFKPEKVIDEPEA